MTTSENRSSWPRARKGPLTIASALAGAGGLLVLAGLAIGGAHLLSAIRQWVKEMEVSPTERARLTWAQGKAAAGAGISAWKSGSGSGVDAATEATES